MAKTVRSDLIYLDILQEAVQAEFAKVNALFGSPAVVTNRSLPSSRADGGRFMQGDTINVPYFNNLGTLDKIVNEGDALTPTKITMTNETATVVHAGKAVEITEWAQMTAMYADPYAEVARQFRVMAERQMDDDLLVAASTGLNAAYVNNVWSSSVPQLLNYDVMVDSKMKWGDEQGSIVFMSVHSKVLGDLYKLKDGNGRPLLVDANDGTLPRFLGIPVRVSDKNTVEDPNGANPKYHSFIYKANALALWMNGAPRVLGDTDILTDSRLTAIHIYYVTHRYQRVAGSTKPGVIEIVTN